MTFYWFSSQIFPITVNEKELESYLKAGKILQKILDSARKSIKPGQKLLEIAEHAEKQIIDSFGAKPAFPVNLSIGNFAAHFTPSAGFDGIVSEEDVLKFDAGVQLNGFVADAAFTLDFSGKNEKMVDASRKALAAAVAKAKVGARIGEIGEAIEKTIRSFGFNPIQNLCGHSLKQFDIHAAPEIPNIAKKDSRVLEEGMAFAIEPFATDGEGYVKEAVQSEIFALDEPKPVRNPVARKILDFVSENYKTLPFAERWIANELKLSDFQRKIAMHELLQQNCIQAFPILHEVLGRLVTQAETTILLSGKEVIVLVEHEY